MIIYEVNLTIKNEIFKDYCEWLNEHIKDMLLFSGFEKAIIYHEKNLSENNKQLTIHYMIKSENDLHEYLENHAIFMRSNAIQKFGDKFTASRRIFHHLTVITL